jgi:hypothetical protein
MRVVRRLVITLSLLELAVILLAGLLAGCSGSGTSPVAPTITASATRLQPGSYYLTLATTDADNGFGFSFCSSIAINSPVLPGPSSGSAPVTVSVIGDEWVLRAVNGSLEARFRSNGNYLAGTASGQATTVGGGSLHIGSSGSLAAGDRPASLTGSAFSDVSAGGTVDGWVGVGGYSCSTGSWSLSR